MNAIDLLKEDHRVVSHLFDQVKNTPASKHRALFRKINAELETHAHIEETVLYPRLKKDGKKDLVEITLEGIEEHRQVKMFLKALSAMKRAGDEFEAKLNVLMEDVDHHVKEEEDEMFPSVKDQFSEAALEKLGVALESRKKKYLSAHPDIARNLVNRKSLKKTGALGTMLEKAMTAVGTAVGKVLAGTMPGNGGASARKSGNGKAKAAKGKAVTPKKAVAKSGPSAKGTSRKAARKGSSGTRRPAASK